MGPDHQGGRWRFPIRRPGQRPGRQGCPDVRITSISTPHMLASCLPLVPPEFSVQIMRCILIMCLLEYPDVCGFHPDVSLHTSKCLALFQVRQKSISEQTNVPVPTNNACCHLIRGKQRVRGWVWSGRWCGQERDNKDRQLG